MEETIPIRIWNWCITSAVSTGRNGRNNSATCQMLITEETVKRRYDNSDSQELYKFMKGISGERALGLYVLKWTRIALRGKRGSNPSALPG